MEKTKLLFPISNETLLRRTEILQDQIKECEGEIPYTFWCDSCKEKMKKVKNFKFQHLKERLQILNNAAYMGVDIAARFSKPTATAFLEYKCLKCGLIYHLCHPGRCECGGEVEPI